MKQGWKIKTLSEVAANVPYPIGDGDHGQIKPKDYRNEGVPYIRVGDMGWGNFNPKEMVYIPEEVHKKNLKSELKPGDILLAKTGATIGKCCIVPNFINKANTTSSVGKITVDQNQILSKWVLLWFLSEQFVKFIWSISNRAAQPGFNNRDIKLFKIPVPPLEEQERLVAKLDQAFAAIDTAKINIEKNLENAKELFQSKLNEIFSQKGEGWVEKKLGEISDVIYGFTDKSVEAGDFRYVRITDIDNNGELISTGKKYISSSKDGKKFILKDNDILMARTGASFAKLLLYKDIEPSIFASYLIKIDFTESIDNEFYWFYAKSNSYWDQANTLSTGSAQPHFNGKALKQVLFPYPVSKAEQKRLINEFKRFQSKTQSLESKYQQELNSLEELKKSILEKAFEGEL